MKKFIFNLIKFSFLLFVIPIAIFLVDPYDYYENSFKIEIDRMQLFRMNNVADWALVEVDKIDQSLKAEVKTCVIGDSRSRLMISSGHTKGWTTRICGIKSDVLDLSFGGANLEESFTILANELENLDSLETVIVSVALDRMLTDNHDVNRIASSSFNSSLKTLNYLTDINMLTSIFENRNKILENRKKVKSDTSKIEEKNEMVSINSLNKIIRQEKYDPEKIKWRKRIVEFKKERFESSIKNRDKTIPVEQFKKDKDKKIRQSFLKNYENGNRTLFDRNLDILKSQLASISSNYEIIVMIPTYDEILYNTIIEYHGDDYKYYMNKLKAFPYKVIDLQDISNEFVFVDPVHGNFENGTLIHKLNYELTSLSLEELSWNKRTANIDNTDSLNLNTSYLSIFPQIINKTKQKTYNFSSTISLRNTSQKDTIHLFQISYYDRHGKLLKPYLKKPIYMVPMEVLEITLDEINVSEDMGSSFIIVWKTPTDCPEPIFLAVMLSDEGTHDVIFTTQAKRLN